MFWGNTYSGAMLISYNINLCYDMLCYPMLWYGMESMVCYEISMLCYEISMLCYAMVYVVKDKHSTTVSLLPGISNN